MKNGLIDGDLSSVWIRLSMTATSNRTGAEVTLKVYGQELERVQQFRFLGVWCDERDAWAVYIQNIITQCKQV